MISKSDEDAPAGVPPEDIAEPKNEDSGEAAESSPPGAAAGEKRASSMLGPFVAVCVVIFVVFFFNKRGPEEPPPGQQEKLAVLLQETQEAVTPVPDAGEPKVFEESTATVEGAPTWRRIFGGAADEEAMSIGRTSGGALIVGGWTRSFGKEEREGWIVKLDADGKEIWSKTYGGACDHSAASVRETSDHGFIAGGSAGNGTASNAWIVKIDSNGAETWSKTFGASGEDNCTGILQTADGGYAFTGRTSSPGTEKSDAWLVKIDSNGNEVWNKTYGIGNHNGADAIAQTGDGGYALTGVTVSSEGGQSDFWIVRTDGTGREIWSRTFGKGVDGRGRAILPTRDGGLLAVGEIQQKSEAETCALLVKVDENGKELWIRTFGDGGDRATSVLEAEDGGYVVAGYTLSSGNTNGSVWLAGFDAEGNRIWTRTCGDILEGRGYSVREAPDGGYVVAGSALSAGSGRRGALLIKVDARGNPAADNPPSANKHP